MKTLVVGDLHGRYEVAEKALASEYNVVFVGDYLDSYSRSSEECLETLRLVVDAPLDPSTTKSVIALKGNHELSYSDLTSRCSGYKTKTQELLDSEFRGWDNWLLDYVWCEGFLISHAGVSQLLLSGTGLGLEDYLHNKSLTEVGYARGGRVPIGGLFWCDWFEEFEPIPDTPQIVGHSGYRPHGVSPGILQKGNSYNVDCLDRVEEFLLIEDGKAEIITL